MKVAMKHFTCHLCLHVASFPPLLLQVFSTPATIPFIGSPYSVTCVVSVTANGFLKKNMHLSWFNQDGSPFASSGDITVESSEAETGLTKSLKFSPLQTIHTGAYTCQATIDSPLLSAPYTTAHALSISASGINVQIWASYY